MNTLRFEELGNMLNKKAQQQNTDFFDLIDSINSLQKEAYIGLVVNFLDRLMTDSKLATQNHIYLYENSHVCILLRYSQTSEASYSISASEVDAIIINLANKTLTIPAFNCHIDQDNINTAPAALTKTNPIALHPHKPCKVRAFDTILDLNSASSQAPLLIIHSLKKSWSTWAFDKTSLQPLRRISTDIRASRIHLTLEMLQAMGVSKAENVLKKIIFSDYDETIRWQAVRYYHKLNKKNIVNMLQSIAKADTSLLMRKKAHISLENIHQG